MKDSNNFHNTQWSISKSNNSSIQNNLIPLGFIWHLREHLITHNNMNLFDRDIEDASYDIYKPIIQVNRKGAVLYSYPLYVFDFAKCNKKYSDRREAFNEKYIDFKRWLLNIFTSFEEYNIFKKEILSILKEIAKNSADHTEENAFFAIDIHEGGAGPSNKKGLEITFSFTDFGKGIYRNIWDSASDEVKTNRETHESIGEAYHLALQMGFSTKKENMGLGMSLITLGAKSIGMELSVFDAKSRGILTSIQSNSHAEIRRNFINTGSSVNFFYYGRIFCEGKNET